MVCEGPLAEQQRCVARINLGLALRLLLGSPHERLDELFDFRFDFRRAWVEFAPPLSLYVEDGRLERLRVHRDRMLEKSKQRALQRARELLGQK